MCFHASNTKTAVQVEQFYPAKFKDKSAYTPNLHFSGFEYPKLPVITNQEQDKIQLYNWGLIPNWSADNKIRQHTLNARYETLQEKQSFKNIMTNRCLILADGFYEWKWLDAKGKSKEQYYMTMPDKSLFAFAGLYDSWFDTLTQTTVNTFTIITTTANAFMAEIHNHGKRMPVILNKEQESGWLDAHTAFYPDANIILTASCINKKPNTNNEQYLLF